MCYTTHSGVTSSLMSLTALRFVPPPGVFFVLDEELLDEELLDEQLLDEELLDEELLDEGRGFECSLMNSCDLQSGLT